MPVQLEHQQRRCFLLGKLSTRRKRTPTKVAHKNRVIVVTLEAFLISIPASAQSEQSCQIWPPHFSLHHLGSFSLFCLLFFFFHLFIFGEYVLEVHKYIWRERSVALSQSFACDSSWHISLCCFDKKWAISLQGTFVKQPVYCVLELLHSKVAKELVSFWITQRPCTLDRGRGLNHAG